MPPAPPLPLTDRLGRPIRDLRLSVTDRCNFRCGYCMPADLFGEDHPYLPRSEILNFDEIERVARLLVGLGARKLRVTGGEPLVRKDLPRLVSRLAAIPGVEDLGLTTNGSLLPQFATALKTAGLQRLTVSLDSLDPEVFLAMSGNRCTLDRVLAGIEAAERAGFSPLKLNCVVERGKNDATLLDLARRFRGSAHIVRFIEFMDVGNCNDWNLHRVVPAAEILRRIGEVFPLDPVPPNYPGEVARRYRYRDGKGEIGVIASVTRPFCGACTRARLSSDGRLFLCLFAADGLDLRGPLREGATDEELRELLARTWSNRTDRYSELRAAAEAPARRKIEMYQIGG